MAIRRLKFAIRRFAPFLLRKQAQGQRVEALFELGGQERVNTLLSLHSRLASNLWKCKYIN